MDFAYLIIHTNDYIETVYKDTRELTIPELQEAVHGYAEIVVPRLLQFSGLSDVRIVCDDCGLMRDNPKMNLLPSVLYGAPSPIVGDVVICSAFNPDPNSEPDIWAFEASRAQQVKKVLHRLKQRLKTAKFEL